MQIRQGMKRLSPLAKTLFIIAVVGLGLLLAIIIIFLAFPEKQAPEEIITPQPDIIQEQAALEENLLSDYANGNYTFQLPYIVQNPYGNSPLTALIIFETTSLTQIDVFVKGKDSFTDLRYQINTPETHHEVPIVGLYPDNDNEVELTSYEEDGSSSTQSFTLRTEPLPNDFPARTLIVSQPESMEPGWTLVNSQTYKYFLDAYGDVRWYLGFKSNNILTILPNGNFLMAYLPTPPYSYGDPADKLVETNLLGKFYVLYFTPFIHHDLIPYHDSYIATVGDEIYQFDQKVGTLKNTSMPLWQFFPAGRIFNFVEDSQSLHVNALVTGGELGDDVLVSARNQQALILVNYPENSLKWIVGTPDGWSPEFQKCLFQPIGEDFEWFWMQHSPTILPDQDGDPNTTDILLFDNGANRNGQAELSKNDEYSRMVQYRINLQTHTIEQIWEYGKERGAELYSSIKGSANYLPQTRNYLGTFAEVQSQSGEIGYDGVIVEVTREKEPVFEIRLVDTQSIYRSERVSIADLIHGFTLGQQPGLYLEDDYPYTVYSYPQVHDSSVAYDYSHSLYYFCVEKLGSNCQLWLNRAIRYGLIRSTQFSPLTIHIDSLTMIDNDLYFQGKVKLPGEEKESLYLILTNEKDTSTFDISSAIFGDPDDQGLSAFYVNFLNIHDLAAGDYKVRFYSMSSQGISLASTDFVLKIPARDEAQ
jgi:arylsulfate sulfotransferase